MIDGLPKIHRQSLSGPPEVAAAQYRRELAQEVGQFRADSQQFVETWSPRVVEVAALNSEGLFKWDPSSIPSNCSPEQQVEYRQQWSCLHQLASGKLDEEGKAVLQAVGQEVARQAHGEFFVAPGWTRGEHQLNTKAVQLDQQSNVEAAYWVLLHDTPGLEGGQLLVVPFSERELKNEQREGRFDIVCRPTVSLHDIEAGYQFHPQLLAKKP